MDSLDCAHIAWWGPSQSGDALSSVRIGGIGSSSYGKQLRVKILGHDGQSVLQSLSWKIEARTSPNLRFALPLEPHAIGAVLIEIE